METGHSFVKIAQKIQNLFPHHLREMRHECHKVSFHLCKTENARSFSALNQAADERPFQPTFLCTWPENKQSHAIITHEKNVFANPVFQQLIFDDSCGATEG